MKRSNPWRVRLVLVSAALFGSGACSNVPSDSELTVGMGAAALVTSEDESQIAEEALPALAEADLPSAAEEEASGLVDRDPAAESAGYDACDFSERRARIVAAYDTNRNGRLDPDELAALRQDLGDRVQGQLGFRLGRVARLLRHIAFERVRWAFDENNDGRLSLEERLALVEALEHRCQVLRQRLLDQFDANQNGHLDPEELAMARAAYRERIAERRAQVLARYDANGNGALDPSEREALRRDLMERARARREELDICKGQHCDSQGKFRKGHLGAIGHVLYPLRGLQAAVRTRGCEATRGAETVLDILTS
jgi:Ca2+-binding EF-hand superfamily protein